MNIFREVRRVNKKSKATRIKLLLMFSVILIVNTYAWLGIDKDVSLGGLKGKTTPWDVAYYVNEDENQILDQTAVFTIDEFYPGMPEREDIVHIYNLGETGTKIKYEVISVKLFGREILDELVAGNILQTNGNKTSIFADDSKYPFNISYIYDKSTLKGEYVDDETTPGAHATVKFNVDWTYEEGTTDEEIFDRDSLDTEFGKNAYEFYKEPTNDPTKAMEIFVKITSTKIDEEDPDSPGTSEIMATSTTNGIEILSDVDADYAYYIKEGTDTSDATPWTKVAEASGRSYRYTNLLQNTTYSVKVVKLDDAGAEAERWTDIITTQRVGNIAASAVSATSKIGASGDGTIELKLDGKYSADGYYMQYQVLNADETLDMNGAWIKGDKVTGLINGQRLYVIVSDGINKSKDYFELTITGLEEF